MNTKTLSGRASLVIEEYAHFKIGQAVSPIPYFNNKTTNKRATLKAYIGKGSPRDIFDEVESIAVKNHIPVCSLADESLKKILLDNNIGVDCSAFAYYILNAESIEKSKGQIDKHIRFTRCRGLVGKIRCYLRPAENCDVATLADDKNSRIIKIKDVCPGDFIAMTNSSDDNDHERDHILIIYQVEYQNFVPTRIHYAHAVAYPEDGVEGTGVKLGEIDILAPDDNITKARWIENGKTEDENRLSVRAKKSNTEIRRLKWW